MTQKKRGSSSNSKTQQQKERHLPKQLKRKKEDRLCSGSLDLDSPAPAWLAHIISLHLCETTVANNEPPQNWSKTLFVQVFHTDYSSQQDGSRCSAGCCGRAFAGQSFGLGAKAALKLPMPRLRKRSGSLRLACRHLPTLAIHQ